MSADDSVDLESSFVGWFKRQGFDDETPRPKAKAKPKSKNQLAITDKTDDDDDESDDKIDPVKVIKTSLAACNKTLEKITVALKKLPADEVTHALRARMKAAKTNLEKMRRKLMAYSGDNSSTRIVAPLAASYKQLEIDVGKMLKQSKGFK